MSDVDHLTDIYLDVAEDIESTTKHQHEQRGSWRLSAETDTRIRDTITEMQERYDLRTQLSDEQLVTLIKAFFDGDGDGDGDTAIARQLGDASLDKTVTRARLGLHLFRESDTTADFDVEALRECFAAENSGAECARQLDIGKSTANRYRRIFTAKDQAERVDNEYYERFRRYCRDDTDEDPDPDFDPDYSPDDGLSDAVADAGADNPQLQ
jgi:hypothetical protein